MTNKAIAYAVPNRVTPGNPVLFNPEICDGCNRCLSVCPEDVFIPNPQKGKPPLILHPDECWYCGPCVDDCPRPGAIRLNHPLQQRVRWKRKDSGELFRV
jgi:NAD-dependent dihydropyrimidine dehydrogenase PreA subunit